MNDRGRDVLLEASLNGLPQSRHLPAVGGLSAVGLLLQAVGCGHLLLPVGWFLVLENMAAHAKCWRRASRRYGINTDEWNSLNRENDELGWDFLTMAWQHTRARETSFGDSSAASITSPPVLPFASAQKADSSAGSAQSGHVTFQEGASIARANAYTGRLKRCYCCNDLIYLHLDVDRQWRPYDAWKSGAVLPGQWRLHQCS